MAEVPQEPLVLNYDALLETLRRSVRRSIVMMGFGLNGAELRPPLSHVLAHDGPFAIRLVEEDVTDEAKEHFADEFGKWVRANGLRELLESFSIYLHQLYFTLYVIRHHAEGGAPAGLRTPEWFEGRGVTVQMDELSKVVPIHERSKAVVASLSQARNCYAHRRGRVGNKDVDGDSMVVTWNRLTFGVREPNGNVIPENEIIGRLLPEGGVVQVAVVETARRYALGDELILEKRELKEICLNVLQIGEALYAEAVNVAVAAGLMDAPAVQDAAVR